MRAPPLLLVTLLAACTAAADAPGTRIPVAPDAPDPVPPTATADAPAPAADLTTTAAVAPPSPHARIEDEQNTIDVFRAAAPATVFVTQTQVVVDYWNRRTMEVPAGSGSGFVWDHKGNVVTNYHVVDGGKSYTVTLQDQSEWPARLVGGDPRKDVAVLHIDAPVEKLVPIRVPTGNDAVEVGQKAIAIGNPFGLDHTLTTGVISAMDREIVGYGNLTIRGMLQTDASINPGNSGGPLLDSAGELIGMNSMIYSKSGSSAGIGFAVPVATVRRVVDQILEKGRVEQLGIGIRMLDAASAQRIGITGVAIMAVVPDSPAEKAGLRGFSRTGQGLRLGDVIVRADDVAIADYDDLYGLLDDKHAGDTVTFTLRRDGQERKVALPLVEVTDGG
jgi:S1-C subfamily serine protease